MKSYKYLVVCGCSQTHGQGCHVSNNWPTLLAKKLNLTLINLAISGTGWYHVESSVSSFINNNQAIIGECFFILQKSALERRVNYEELPICRTDAWEHLNMKFLSPIAVCCVGYHDWERFGMSNYKPDWWDSTKDLNKPLIANMWEAPTGVNKFLKMFPEHKHYPNSRHFWKLGDNFDVYPPYIHEQFEELMLHWAIRISSFHLFMKSNNLDHIIVDGYSPFLSYKLNFSNYYDIDDEYFMTNKFWSTESDKHDEEMIYDFRNIKCGWIFDNIDDKYKIDDVILWSLYQFKPHQSDWNVDGGHAGPLGMKLIKNVIYQNLIKKGWFKNN
jgi:hypothetical protein